MLIIFGGQFLVSSHLVTGTPPAIVAPTLNGENALARVSKGPELIYFWAEWCGICRGMQTSVSHVAQDFPVLTVAVDSGDAAAVNAYLQQHKLDWTVVNDDNGKLFASYGGRGVPAVFVLNPRGDIVFTTAGYTGEWGLRARLWLARWF